VNFVTENIFLIAIACASGAMLLWPMINRGMAGGAAIGTLQATRLMNDRNAVIVDVRPAAEFAAGHLPGARNLAADDLAKRGADLPAGPIIVVDATGGKAGKAAGALKAAGRQEVFTLEGGIQQWLQAGLPLVK
jgi:rhodanese-related sulfurtransferase